MPSVKSEENWNQFNEIISSFMTQQQIPGVSLAIKLKNQELYLQCKQMCPKSGLILIWNII